PNSSVIGGRSQPAPVRTESHAPHRSVMSDERGNRIERLDVKEKHLPIPRAHSKSCITSIDREGRDEMAELITRPQWRSRAHIPGTNRLIARSGVEHPTVLTEENGENICFMIGDLKAHSGRLCVPQPDGSVSRSRGDGGAIRAEANGSDA